MTTRFFFTNQPEVDFGIAHVTMKLREHLPLVGEKQVPYFSVDNAHPKLFRHSFIITFDLPLIPF
jgi:hypothetical protein